MLTPFETSGVRSTRAEGEAFLAALAAATDVTLQSYGLSVDGNPMTAATIGDGPVKVAVIGAIHGSEPAGREASFKFLRDLAETVDTGLLSYLAGAAWTFMPTSNPDSIDSLTRESSNGVDLNRDHKDRREPETQAIHAWLQAATPALVIDLHETISGKTPDVAWGVQERTDIHPDLRARSVALKDVVVSALTTAGYGVVPYPATALTEGTMRNEAGRIHKATALLLETRTTTRTLAQRTARHLLALTTAREDHETNAAAYDAARAAALSSTVNRRGAAALAFL